MNKEQARRILELPLGTNDVDAETIGGYFVDLMQILWLEGETFSGKRPFGCSDWEVYVWEAIWDAGLAERDDWAAAEKLVAEALAWAHMDVSPNENTALAVMDGWALAREAQGYSIDRTRWPWIAHRGEDYVRFGDEEET